MKGNMQRRSLRRSLVFACSIATGFVGVVNLAGGLFGTSDLRGGAGASRTTRVLMAAEEYAHYGDGRSEKERLEVEIMNLLTKYGLADSDLKDFVMQEEEEKKDGDVYSLTPFCSPTDGTCGEAADIPSPRTVYSANTKKEYDDWWNFHAKLNSTALEYANAMLRSSGGRGTKRPLILLGDSITDGYLSTEDDQPQGEIFREVYANYSPLILGVRSDQTQHLLWRLQNGALLPAYANDPDAIFYVLIGTNNLSAGHIPQDTGRGVLAVADYLMERIRGRLILLELLPRGDTARLERLCPGPRCDKDGMPLTSFKPDIFKVGYALRNAMAKLAHQYPARIHLINCGEAFYPDPDARARGEEVNVALMPDRLHPNAEGHRALSRCVLGCIEHGKC